MSKEYKLVWSSQGDLESKLNELAQKGWRVVAAGCGPGADMIVMER